MKFETRNDLIKNLDGSVFYSAKLKRAIQTRVGDAALQLIVYAASKNAFDKRITTLDASKEFHLRSLTPGFAPRLHKGNLLFADRLPKRQWRFGWSTNNTCYSSVFPRHPVVNGTDGLSFVKMRILADFTSDEGFFGNCWTGAFSSIDDVLGNGRGSLSPTIAVYDKHLLGFAGIIGEIDRKKNANIYQDAYNSFLVRELQQLGVNDVKEVQNG